MIHRDRHLEHLRSRLDNNPVVAIIGARQVGKTTLAQDLARTYDGRTTFFDLEHPRDRARLEDPLLALESLRGLVIIDEIQHAPGLFAVLRVLADQPVDRTFLILGSASPELLAQSESLAGRIAYYRLGGFDLDEVSVDRAEELWLRGSFPRSFLAVDEQISATWRRDFIDTYLQRDLPQLGRRVSAPTMRRFWTMLAHYHGQVWNGAELARAFGVSAHTVRRYLDTLCATFVVRQLAPWHENVGKRQVKSPKVYLTDSGILHTLLGLETREDVEGHPKVGASFEGFALDQVIARLEARPEACFFWATHAGAELDLLVLRGDRRLGFEFKRTSAPRMTRSMHIALAELHLDRLDVVYPGDQTFPLAERVRAVGLTRLLVDLSPSSFGASSLRALS